MKLYLPDGEGGWHEIDVDENTSIYVENIVEGWDLPTASETVKGGIKVGKGLYMTNESLNADFPTASESVKGGAKIGDGLQMSDEVLSLRPATKTDIGGVRIGQGLIMTGDLLSAVAYSLPTMSDSIKGGAKVGAGLVVVDANSDGNADALTVDLRTAVEREFDDVPDPYIVQVNSSGKFRVPAVTCEQVIAYGDTQPGYVVYGNMTDETSTPLVFETDFFYVSGEDHYGYSGTDNEVFYRVFKVTDEVAANLKTWGISLIWENGAPCIKTSVGKIVLGNNLRLSGDTLHCANGTMVFIGKYPFEPFSAQTGNVYFNTVTKKIYMYDGEQWLPL